MLYLLFKLNQETVALKAGDVIEVIPFVRIRPIHNTPEYIAGEINYRGSSALVVDLQQLYSRQQTQRLLSTRIIMVRYGETVLGLIAGEVTDTAQIADEDFLPDTGGFEGIRPQRCVRLEGRTVACYEVATLLDSLNLTERGGGAHG